MLRWLFSSQFWLLLKRASVFWAAGAVEFSSSLRSSNCNQVKLAQIRETHCRPIKLILNQHNTVNKKARHSKLIFLLWSMSKCFFTVIFFFSSSNENLHFYSFISTGKKRWSMQICFQTIFFINLSAFSWTVFLNSGSVEPRGSTYYLQASLGAINSTNYNI